MRHMTLWFGLVVMSLLCGSCAWQKTANEWNGLVGPTGDQVYLNSTTKFGFNFLVFFPFLGEIGLEGMVEEATGTVQEEGGNYVRVVQSHSDNYWYALPPITWVVTPVVNSLVVEYRPGEQEQVSEPPPRTEAIPAAYPEQSYYWKRNEVREADYPRISRIVRDK